MAVDFFLAADFIFAPRFFPFPKEACLLPAFVTVFGGVAWVGSAPQAGNRNANVFHKKNIRVWFWIGFLIDAGLCFNWYQDRNREDAISQEFESVAPPIRFGTEGPVCGDWRVRCGSLGAAPGSWWRAPPCRRLQVRVWRAE